MPPVTALRSPPDSRITGALSPVITDSSTVAMPSITSPSPGIMSPASQETTSPARNFEAGTCSIFPSLSIRLAIASVLVLRRESACALPRASAIASAKFANSTVNHSHTEIWNVNPMPAAPTMSRTRKMVVSRAHFHHEHHRILQQRDRIQLHERCLNRAIDDLRMVADPADVLPAEPGSGK